MSFSSLGLSEALARAVAAREFSTPTPVQVEAIPAILRGGDVWACAQTGSGKTAAYVLPLLQRFSATGAERPRRLQGLVLVPTRELAAQVADALRVFGACLHQPPKTVVAIGGVSINPQMMALRGGADFVVATPGRLLDLVDHRALQLSAVATVILDEADRLLDLGFSAELGRILGLLPARRQSLLFSATFPPAVQTLAAGILREPTRIEVASGPATAPDIVQRAIETDEPRRTQLLRQLIETEGWSRVLVFVATKYATEHVADKLRRAGLTAVAFHGELSQGARTEALTQFKASHAQVLVVTDLAARGLDIAQLPAVVNYDLPRSAVDYVHRIGRTGRAGQRGVAVSFITAATDAHFRLIEKRHHLALPREQIAGFEPIELAVPAPAVGGVKGKRKSKKDKLREAAARAQNPGAPAPATKALPSPKPAAGAVTEAYWSRRPAPGPRR